MKRKSRNFLFYATVRYVHHWSRGARSGRYESVPTPFYPPTTGRRSMRVTVVERSRAQSSLDRRQVCVVDRCTRLSLCVDSAWFFVRLASFFPFSLPFPSVPDSFISCTDKEISVLYVTCARKPLVAQRVGPVVKHDQEER